MARDSETMKKELRKLSIEADKKLRKLEKLSQKKGYENVKEFAYRRAMKDIRYWSEGSKRSFKSMMKTDNINSLQGQINAVKRFLEAPTSAKSSIDELFKRRAESLNEHYGTNFDWQDLANVFDRADENVYYQKGSKSYLKAVSYLKDNEEQIMENLYDISMGEKTIRTGNSKVNKLIAEILDKEGIQFTSLYR